jgi:hypothetical protein
MEEKSAWFRAVCRTSYSGIKDHPNTHLFVAGRWLHTILVSALLVVTWYRARSDLRVRIKGERTKSKNVFYFVIVGTPQWSWCPYSRYKYIFSDKISAEQKLMKIKCQCMVLLFICISLNIKKSKIVLNKLCTFQWNMHLANCLNVT